MEDAKLVIISVIALVGLGAFVLYNFQDIDEGPQIHTTELIKDIKKFSSIDELREFLIKSSNQNFFSVFGYNNGLLIEARESVASSGSAPWMGGFAVEESLSLARRADDVKLSSTEYSTTNIQVQNVDEPDFVKNDGKYLYILIENKLRIIDAFPPENAQTILEMQLDIPVQNNVQNLFLNKDRLVVLYHDLIHKVTVPDESLKSRSLKTSSTFALVLDVSDKNMPKVIKEYSIDGQYHDARMIDNFVYLITKEGANYRHLVTPEIRESKELIQSPDIYYFDDMERPSTFTTVAAFDVFGNTINSETYLLGTSDTIYVSENAIYLTFQRNYPTPAYFIESFYDSGLLDGLVEPLPTRTQKTIQKLVDDSEIPPSEKWQKISDIITESYGDLSTSQIRTIANKLQGDLSKFSEKIALDSQKTVIYKIKINEGEFDYSASNQVLGHLLNQFSMDEHEDKFRVATTIQFFGRAQSFMHNNVYIFDEDLKLLGSLEEVAPNEKIYSARFMGEDLYLVTFRQVDPFFVIDMSENTPRILGELKIPGFSTYLHPFGDDHVIGIGRDADSRGRQEGIKIAMFDVSNFYKPKMTDEIIIGNSRTWSAALDNHKAILIDENKSILSIPIRGADLFSQSDIEKSLYPDSKVWNGFYVFGIDTDEGFDLMGKILHDGSSNQMHSRSLYIEDALYTISQSIVKINDLNDLANEINSIVL